ncbi:MAG: SDR family oxidoreductase [Gemmataceae bacterium]
MDLHLQGHGAVVIGAARGIGEAIARAFAAEHACVALIDRDPLVHTTAQSLPESFALVTDVTDFAAVQASAQQCHKQLGRIDHVVFAVGIGSGKYGFPFWNLQPGDWPRVFEVNVMGAVHVAHAFVPSLVAMRSGTLLFLSSVAGQIGSQTDPPYSASKAALLNFMQCAARDLASYGVRVNALCPGMVQTALNRSVYEAWAALQPEGQRSSYEEWAAAKIERVVPLKRWQTPQDIAHMAVFLASDRAANVTGQTINVDGGFVMH